MGERLVRSGIINWRRGFFRVWVVLSAFWIVGSWWITDPVFWTRILTTEHVVFYLGGQGFDFPPDTERAVVERTLNDFMVRRLSDYKRAHPLKLSEVEKPVDQHVAEAIGNYHPYFWPRLIVRYWGPIVLPPVGLMLAAMVAVWFIHGFRRELNCPQGAMSRRFPGGNANERNRDDRQ